MPQDQPTNTELVEQLSTGFGSLGSKITEIGTALATADTVLQVAHLVEFITPLTKLPNVMMEQVEELPEPFGSVVRQSSRPVISLVNGERFSFKEAEFDFDMSIGANTTAKTETGVDAKTEAGVSGGGFGFSAHASMSCEVSHRDEQTRATKMDARIHMKLKMAREDLSEGMKAWIDESNEFSRTMNQLRMQFAVAKVQQITQQISTEGVPMEVTEPSEAESAPAVQ